MRFSWFGECQEPVQLNFGAIGWDGPSTRALTCYHDIRLNFGWLRKSNMDITRKANREAQEATLQYRSRQEALLDDELIDDKLAQLLAFIGNLRRTPEGAAEIRRQVASFGECKRSDGETSAEFYAKLRHWLDRDKPRTKSPRHAAMQTGGGPAT
jgi:hypothetical protein